MWLLLMKAPAFTILDKISIHGPKFWSAMSSMSKMVNLCFWKPLGSPTASILTKSFVILQLQSPKLNSTLETIYPRNEPIYDKPIRTKQSQSNSTKKHNPRNNLLPGDEQSGTLHMFTSCPANFALPTSPRSSLGAQSSCSRILRLSTVPPIDPAVSPTPTQCPTS